jgi:cytochrome c-type biogenesis protein
VRSIKKWARPSKRGASDLETQSVSVLAALIAGMLSFFSPCVLPLVPVYLGYMSGTVVGQPQDRKQPGLLLHALLFVLGFSFFLVILGGGAGLLGSLLYPIMPYVTKIGGLVLIVFGLHLTGLISIPFLNMDKRLELGQQRKSGYWTSLLIGLVFAAGWTPCIGPVLAAILLLAADSRTAFSGATLMAVYALGLGIPFLVVALLINVALPVLRTLNRHLHMVSILSGALLMLMGFLLLTGTFERLVIWINSLSVF